MSLQSEKTLVTFDQSTKIHNTNIEKLIPLISPAVLNMFLPSTNEINQLVIKTRNEISNIIHGNDDRIILIVGPCSIHDTNSALEYAKKLNNLKQKFKNEVLIIMRCYFEKPRTISTSWKGLINDPNLNNTCKINDGIKIARQLLLNINEIGLPCAYECLDTITIQYIADLISWSCVGARTVQSQVHRQLSSGLSMPVGFKNGTSGETDIAINAILSAQNKQSFLSITQQGCACIVNSKGNKNTHIVLRGGNNGPNYDSKSVEKVQENLEKNNILGHRILIDCSHGNSNKNYKNQSNNCENISKQISNGNKNIIGIMIESNLKEGKQKLILGKPDELLYGVSITDSCISIETTEKLINIIAESVKKRRKM